MREIWEEAGVVVRLTRLVGVFGGPDFVVQYLNGDRTSYAMAVFAGGGLRPACPEAGGGALTKRTIVLNCPAWPARHAPLASCPCVRARAI